MHSVHFGQQRGEAALRLRPACRRAWTGSTAWGPERSERAITHTRTQVERYRLAISTHGNGNEWSNRFRTLLSSGAAVLKQARPRLVACVVGRADGQGGEGGSRTCAC